MDATAIIQPADISLPSPPLEPKLQLATQFEMNTKMDAETSPRPISPATAPLPPASHLSVQTPSRPRTQSPSSRGHLRSQSSTLSTYAPQMQRAHSSPGVDATGRIILPLAPRRPSSPSSYSGRRRSPLRATVDDSYPVIPTWSGLNIEPNLSDHAAPDTSSSTVP